MLKKVTGLMPSLDDIKRILAPIVRGTSLGAVLGILPGGGAMLASFSAYALEKKVSKNSANFGKGAIEGVAAPEAANNAGAQTSFIPMLTLGIPSNPVMALMIGAMIIQGIQPGPSVMTEQPALFWGIVVSMWVGNVMLLVLNLPLAGVWVRLLAIPRPYLYGGILVLASLGVYSLHGSVFDLGILYAVGLLGYVMRCADIPIAPAIIGLILGPLAEQQFRRALAISQGDVTVFFTRPISATILALAAAALLVPLVARRLRKAN
jgi:TctA family transporter